MIRKSKKLLIILVCVLAALIGGGGGFCIYWFGFYNKSHPSVTFVTKVNGQVREELCYDSNEQEKEKMEIIAEAKDIKNPFFTLDIRSDNPDWRNYIDVQDTTPFYPSTEISFKNGIESFKKFHLWITVKNNLCKSEEKEITVDYGMNIQDLFDSSYELQMETEQTMNANFLINYAVMASDNESASAIGLNKRWLEKWCLEWNNDSADLEMISEQSTNATTKRYTYKIRNDSPFSPNNDQYPDHEKVVGTITLSVEQDDKVSLNNVFPWTKDQDPYQLKLYDLTKYFKDPHEEHRPFEFDDLTVSDIEMAFNVAQPWFYNLFQKIFWDDLDIETPVKQTDGTYNVTLKPSLDSTHYESGSITFTNVEINT